MSPSGTITLPPCFHSPALVRYTVVVVRKVAKGILLRIWNPSHTTARVLIDQLYRAGWFEFIETVCAFPLREEPDGGFGVAGWKAVTLHTDLGDLKLELFCEQVSKACENFLVLCASDYYNGCIFHRNIRGFMVQTGDPTGTGKGGTSIWGRKFEDEFNEHLKHNVRGVVSLANSGPNTNGSQFFITYGKQPHLDMKYTIFGKVIDGLETLDDLEKLPVQEKTYRPLTNTCIKTITIHANPFAP